MLITRLWLAAGALSLVHGAPPAIAQVPAGGPSVIIPPSEQPGRERERFTEPTPPRAEPGGPRISLPSTIAPAGADKIVISIRDVRIEGSTVYTPEELRPLYAELLGHEISLAAVYDLAQRITAKYGADGYALSRATVPPQDFDLRDGVRITAASVGGGLRLGWITNLNADLNVAKAIDGPRNDTRFFFAVTMKY